MSTTVTSELRSTILARYNTGESIRTIRDALGIGFGTVQRALYRIGATVRPTGKARTYTLNESAFDDPLSPEAAYWIGLIMADGCLMRRRYGLRVSLQLSGDDGLHLERFRTFLKTDHPLYHTAARQRGYINQGPSAKLTIDSNRIGEALLRYGVSPNKSHTARVAGLETNLDFWRGVVDGDGFVYLARDRTKPRPVPVVGLVGSRPLLEQFRILLVEHAGTTAHVLPMHSIWRIETRGTCAVRAARLLYGSAHVALPRKLKAALSLLTPS